MTCELRLGQIDRSPLSIHESILIDAAATFLWTPSLRAALAFAWQLRGGYVGSFDTCGDLADALELAARGNTTRRTSQ